MSGRRTRNAVQRILDKCTSLENKVVIAGLSNTYSSYISTFEEYQVQRYEGASTMYGQHTLKAYIQSFEELAESLCTGEPAPNGPQPPNMLEKQISLQPGVIFDTSYIGKGFGDVISDVKDSYLPGETASVTFVSGHPRNNGMLESTFMSVERLSPSGNWSTIATDADWETKFHWVRTNIVLGHSEATASWEIPSNTKPGKYRIRHFGFSKSILQTISSYRGSSKPFVVRDKKSCFESSISGSNCILEPSKKSIQTYYLKNVKF